MYKRHICWGLEVNPIGFYSIKQDHPIAYFPYILPPSKAQKIVNVLKENKGGTLNVCLSPPFLLNHTFFLWIFKKKLIKSLLLKLKSCDGFDEACLSLLPCSVETRIKSQVSNASPHAEQI